MKNDSLILKNKPLPAIAETVIERETSQGNEVIFVIVGDLNLKGKYSDTALIFTWDSAIYVDDETGEESRFLFSEMSDVVSKRMYGNATLSALMPDGKRKIFFRYTYAVASLCDAAALFINHIRDGESRNEELAIMAVTFERALSVCPKCGRTLLHPGAECIMCRSKMKRVKQLSTYIKPQSRRLIVCIILSLITTAMALVPPMITGFIVDVVFPGGSGISNVGFLNRLAAAVGTNSTKLLFIMIGCLFSTYILQ